jgi:hypothetical protein
MPLYGSYLQRECYLFFNNLEENLKFSYNKNDIIDIEKTKEKIDKTIKLFDEAWLDMMYEGEFAEYYDKFAKNNNEEELLKESDYVIFSLDEYEIELANGNYRTWVYEKELYDIRDILKEKKKNIENDINEFNINAGVTLALLYTNL